MNTTDQYKLEWNGDARGALACARMMLVLPNRTVE